MKYRDIFEAKRRSEDYRLTYHVGDPDGEARYDALRKSVIDHNRQNPDSQLYLKQRGRLGRNNPARSEYPKAQWDGGYGWSHTAHKDAQRFDVYVRPKHEYEYGEGKKKMDAEWAARFARNTNR